MAENDQPQPQAQPSSETPPVTESKPVETSNGETKIGRPKLTPQEIVDKKSLVLQKIEPYLKSGLSVNKALHEAQIVSSEFYEYMSDDETFRERIDTFRQFVSVLANNAIVKHLQDILQRQNGYSIKNPKTGAQEQVPAQKLKKEDTDFLWKFVLTSNLTKGEFGERKDINLFDPEAEIQKVKGILQGNATKTIDHSKDVALEDE